MFYIPLNPGQTIRQHTGDEGRTVNPVALAAHSLGRYNDPTDTKETR